MIQPPLDGRVDVAILASMFHRAGERARSASLLAFSCRFWHVGVTDPGSVCCGRSGSTPKKMLRVVGAGGLATQVCATVVRSRLTPVKTLTA